MNKLAHVPSHIIAAIDINFLNSLFFSSLSELQKVSH